MKWPFSSKKHGSATPSYTGVSVECGFCHELFNCLQQPCSGPTEEHHYHTCAVCMSTPQLRQLFVRVEVLEKGLRELVDRLT